VATAAGNAVLDYLESHKLFERVAAAAKILRAELDSLQSHAHVGEIRGLGLLLAVEFVRDKATREPFPNEDNVAERIRQPASDENVLTYPSQGCFDGLRGDHILLAPPLSLRAKNLR
jgi:adenosylmethionine-8-amino-7-oxononanoate aminotransferase